jgi:hypothetical protein
MGGGIRYLICGGSHSASGNRGTRFNFFTSETFFQEDPYEMANDYDCELFVRNHRVRFNLR